MTGPCRKKSIISPPRTLQLGSAQLGTRQYLYIGRKSRGGGEATTASDGGACSCIRPSTNACSYSCRTYPSRCPKPYPYPCTSASAGTSTHNSTNTFVCNCCTRRCSSQGHCWTCGWRLGMLQLGLLQRRLQQTDGSPQRCNLGLSLLCSLGRLCKAVFRRLGPLLQFHGVLKDRISLLNKGLLNARFRVACSWVTVGQQQLEGLGVTRPGRTGGVEEWKGGGGEGRAKVAAVGRHRGQY